MNLNRFLTVPLARSLRLLALFTVATSRLRVKRLVGPNRIEVRLMTLAGCSFRSVPLSVLLRPMDRVVVIPPLPGIGIAPQEHPNEPFALAPRNDLSGHDLFVLP